MRGYETNRFDGPNVSIVVRSGSNLRFGIVRDIRIRFGRSESRQELLIVEALKLLASLAATVIVRTNVC